jgi:hypothetical protein
MHYVHQPADEWCVAAKLISESQSFARIGSGIGVIFHCVQRDSGRHAFVRSSPVTAMVATITLALNNRRRKFYTVERRAAVNRMRSSFRVTEYSNAKPTVRGFISKTR